MDGLENGFNMTSSDGQSKASMFPARYANSKQISEWKGMPMDGPYWARWVFNIAVHEAAGYPGAELDLWRVEKDTMQEDAKQFDIIELEQALENAEDADAEVHKLYNNLGLAHAAAGNHRQALKAHREEKHACQRLIGAAKRPDSRHLDLSIAYRRCGDATLRVDSLLVTDGSRRGRIRRKKLTSREEIARRAHEQHRKALSIAMQARDAGVRGACFEVQAASAAMAYSSLQISLEAKCQKQFATTVCLCNRAAMLAENLSDDEANGAEARYSMILSAAVNLSIAMSGLGHKQRAKTLFEAVGVRAKEMGDTTNLIRCVANLAEEASEESDWQLCLEHVDMWIALAKQEKDLGEEAGALLKRGTALFELGRLTDAHTAFDRAAVIGRDDQAREEARRHLESVETELEEIRKADEALKDLVPRCMHALDIGDAVSESRLRLQAGEAAFKLRKNVDVLEHLGRYFVLVDEYGCVPSATGVEEIRYCNAFATMAEVHWREKRPALAVEWGMRELSAFKDDIAGQAQAWCNIGIYLDEDGKQERAKEALSRSILLAKRANDEPLLRQAESNLKVVIANQSENERMLDKDESEHTDGVASEARGVRSIENNPVQSVQTSEEHARTKSSPTGARNCHESEVHSVVDYSGNFARTSSFSSPHVPDLDTSHDGCVSRNTHADHSRAHSRDMFSTGTKPVSDRSSFAMGRHFDLAAAYKNDCSVAASKRGEAVTARDVLVERLRSLSAKLVAADDSEVVSIDLSATFLEDDEFSLILRSLARIREREPLLSIDLRFNPLLSGRCFNRFVTYPRGPLFSFPAVYSLDLSGTGLDSASFAVLARAMGRAGALCQVTHLSAGKNALGRSLGGAADALAVLLVQSNVLRTVDLSLNLLSDRFLFLLMDNIDCLLRKQSGATFSESRVEQLDLRLNNRQSPKALLECDADSVDFLIDRTRRLFQAIPSLRTLDVRACGATREVRHRLYCLGEELRSSPCRESEGSDPVELRITSASVYDDAECAFLEERDSSPHAPLCSL